MTYNRLLHRVFGRTVAICSGCILPFALAVPGCASPIREEDPADRVEKIVVVGTAIDQTLYATGDLGLTFVPTDAREGAVLSDRLVATVRVVQPTGLTVQQPSTRCTPAAGADKAIAVGIVLDDSGSMESNDPANQRRDAAAQFLRGLRAGDEALLTDYGHTLEGSPLRDLVCSQAGRESCSPPTADAFTSDKQALIAATQQIESFGDTPLFASCIDMVPLVAARRDRRQAILLLSDGEPTDEEQREACHAAAQAAKIPIFTVGLGPAAEGDEFSSSEAVRVLRDLALATGGAYAPATAPQQLAALFANMGVALTRGNCESKARIVEKARIVPGTKVKGEIAVGRASASFEFVAPLAPEPPK